MLANHLLLLLSLFAAPCVPLDISPVPQGFPDVWEGDSYHQAECEIIQQPPTWVDGFLIAQSAGSYGNQSSPLGQKMTHIFDAISGVSVYDTCPTKPTFTGAYYPTTRGYKIWEYNDRDFTKSKVAWQPTFSYVNATAKAMWSALKTEGISDPPNVDFWKIGNTIVAGTESYYQFGLQFDLPKVNNFKQYMFKDTDPAIVSGQMYLLQMPIHEHVDPTTGLIWTTSVGANMTAQTTPTFHQVVFTVDPDGTRRTQGVFNFSPVDISKCNKNGSYSGEMTGNGIIFPRNMHTVTATENYLILPMTSLYVRVCQVIQGPVQNPDNLTIYDPFKEVPFDWNQQAPVVFLLFDKKSKKFLDPIESPTPQFFTHQFNSYETGRDGEIYVDLIAFDRTAYDALDATSLMKKNDHPEMSNHAYRYTIDYKKKTVSSRSLLAPNDPTKVEFSQINHKFEAKAYKYGYVVQFPFMQPSQIIKIDMDTPSGEKNKYFKPGPTISMAEPYFSARPGGTAEDDGVIVVRGLDSSINRTRVYVVNASTMEKVGEILSPYYSPFGLHERFYLKEQLGIQKANATMMMGNEISAEGSNGKNGFFSFFEDMGKTVSSWFG